MTYTLSESCTLTLVEGDITRQAVDAIVNAANPIMLGGGGVDGAIHRAAGRQLRDACAQVPALNGARRPTGEARITPGFNLPARFAIHTVGPVYRRSARPAAQLAAAHRSSLALAVENGVQTIAFPAISCGVYGYPHGEAARVALTTCRDHCDGLTEIRFVLFGESMLRIFRQIADREL